MGRGFVGGGDLTHPARWAPLLGGDFFGVIVMLLGKFRRNMPDRIPVVILARLAIDISYQGRELGRALFRDAALRVMRAADPIGIRGIIARTLASGVA